MLMLRKIAPRLATTRSALTGLVLLATLAAGQEGADGSAAAQDNPGRKTPSLSMAPSPIITVTRGQPSAPADIVIGRVGYPAGSEMSFTLAPEDKLSVYTGEFPVVVEVRPLAEVITAKYMIRGELRYQACDNAACYPPKKLPVQFEVKVVKAPPPPRKNPGQSPHVHL